MLKWLVQKMPDPLKNGIGIDDDRGIKIENLTDDPLATLDFKDNDNLSAIRKSLHPSNWLTIGSSSEEYAWKEVYSVNRSNPLYNDNESYYPGNPRNEPTSSVFGLASTQSDPSSTYSTMTNSKENNVANLQNETPILSSQNLGPNFADNPTDNTKGHNTQSRDALTSKRSTDSNDAKVILRPDTHREMNNQMVPDSLEPVIKHHQLIAPSLHSQSTDVVKRGTREVSPVPAPIWPKYVAKGHVYNAIQKLNRIRPSTPTPLMNKNSQDDSSVSQDFLNKNVPSSDNTNDRDIESNFKQNKGPQPTNSNFESHDNQDESKKERRIGVTNNAFIDSEDHRSKTSSDVPEKKSAEEPIYKESCIHKNTKYVSNIQIIQLNAQMKSGPIVNNGPKFCKKSQERNLQKGQSDPIITEDNELDEPIFDNRNRNMSPITEQSNEDSSSDIPAHMVSSQNDSIVTDTLLQLTSFSLKSLNEGDNIYDTTNKGLKQIDENLYIDATKNTSANREVEEEDKKKEDMDKVIQELTKAVMKSKNVTTLTRAMNQRKALFVDSPYLSQRNRGGIKIVDGSKPYLTSKDSTGSTSSGITISSTSTEDSLERGSTRRSRRFKRNANRMRNSVRTIQSLSRGSKGVDLMRNLWQQTGMITNGRKLLIDSLSEDEGSVSSGGLAKNVPSNMNEPDHGILIENRRFQMIIENEARYTEEPTSFQKANALEKDLLKRISSGGSTTTATYAEVYSKSQASSTSPGSSLGHSQSSNAQKILKSNNVIQSDANKTKISQSVNLSADEIRVDEDHRESLSSGSSVSGVPNAKSGRKVQFRRDVIANNQEVFTIENYDHIPIHGFSNNEKIKTASSIVNMNEIPNQQYGEPSNRWFIPSNRDFVHGKSDLEAYKQLREKSSSSASARSTSVSPIYNDTNDDKSSSSYKSIFSSPYFDYRKTHSKAGSSIYGRNSNTPSAISIPNSTHLMQRAALLEEQKKRDRQFWKAFSFFLGMTLILGLVVSLTIYFTYDQRA